MIIPGGIETCKQPEAVSRLPAGVPPARFSSVSGLPVMVSAGRMAVHPETCSGVRRTGSRNRTNIANPCRSVRRGFAYPAAVGLTGMPTGSGVSGILAISGLGCARWGAGDALASMARQRHAQPSRGAARAAPLI